MVPAVARNPVCLSLINVPALWPAAIRFGRAAIAYAARFFCVARNIDLPRCQIVLHPLALLVDLR